MTGVISGLVGDCAVQVRKLSRCTEEVAAQCEKDDDVSVPLCCCVHQGADESTPFCERTLSRIAVCRPGKGPGFLELINQDNQWCSIRAQHSGQPCQTIEC